MKILFLGLIYVYRCCLRPFLSGQCRFWPSCSSYAEEAINKHGSLTGTFLTFKRLSRCHPWGGEGIDLVPESSAFGPKTKIFPNLEQKR